MKLYICEKPSQGRDIAKVVGANTKKDGYLEGDNVSVTWGFGHLIALAPPENYDPKYAKWHIDTLPIIPATFQSVVPTDKKKQLSIIGQLLKKAGSVVIATDADREGEAIAREILDHYKYNGEVERLWLSALDESSIKKALDNILPGSKTENLYKAALGRSRADWLVGMNLTRAYTVKSNGQGVLSVGRVQTPTLKLVVDRDLTIEQFKLQKHYGLLADLKADDGIFTAKWKPAKDLLKDGLMKDHEKALDILEKMQSKYGIITQYETTSKQEHAPLPYDLATLQQDLSKKYGIGAKETLDIAQSLYEKHKATTYPRTDCQYLPESQLSEVEAVLAAVGAGSPEYKTALDGADRGHKSKAWNDSQISAHHAIIPTMATVKIADMSDNERKAYNLIVQRYITQFYKPYEYEQTNISVDIEGETFTASGKTPINMGWKNAFKSTEPADEEKEAEESENDTLPALEHGQSVHVTSMAMKDYTTKPPQRFTEGTLIAAMKTVGKSVTDPELKKILKETSGIGTEATRAAIIENLFKRGYIAKHGKKNIISTELGRDLINILPDEIKDPATTAVWEQRLDDIALGNGNLKAFIEEQSTKISGLVDSIKNSETSIKQKSEHVCEKCGGDMLRRKGKNGFFWGCSNFPVCRNTMDDKGGRPVKRIIKKKAPYKRKAS